MGAGERREILNATGGRCVYVSGKGCVRFFYFVLAQHEKKVGCSLIVRGIPRVS